MLSWDGILDKNISIEKLLNVVLFILLQNFRNNPWYEQYMTIFEQSKDMKRMCILFSDVIDDIITKHDNSNDGLESIHVNDEIKNLSLLFNMSINLELLINKYLFIMGNMKKND